MQKLIQSMLLAALSWLALQHVHAQLPVYRLNGLTVIDCSNGIYTYTIDTDQSLVTTDWFISPAGATVVSSGLLDIQLFFGAPGLYTLYSTSYTPNNEKFVDSLHILVYGISSPIEIAGCFVENPVTSCRQVCAHSTTTIYGQFPQGEVFITGAASYTTDYETWYEVIWGAEGYGEIYINDGCETTYCFDILPEPVADFTTSVPVVHDTIVVCREQEISFTNASMDGISFHWDFGDGNTATTVDANHAYEATGYYIVTLTASTICDCKSEKQIVVSVLPSPAPTLDCINTVCPQMRQRYTATSDCTLFYWTVSANGVIVAGGGTGDNFIEVIWESGPDGIIELAVDGCATAYCPDVNTFRIPIVTPDGPVEGDASVCANEVVTYTAPYFPGTTYDWNIGASGTILHGELTNAITVLWGDVNTATSTFVRVEYENCFHGCDGSDLLLVRIVPEIRITGAKQVCQHEAADAIALAGFSSPVPANVIWSIEDAQGNIVFSSPTADDEFSHVFSYPAGVYEWVARNTDPNYCNEEIRATIQVTAQPLSPLAIQGETIVCPNVYYGYSVQSAGQYGTFWTIQDGATIHNYTGESIAHRWGNAPPYIVEAHHTDLQFPTCASSSISMAVEAFSNQVMTSPDDACLYTTTAYAYPLSGGVDYAWEVIPADFGEIRRSDLNEVVVFWTQAGNATLRLQACGQVIDKAVTIHTLPSVNVIGAGSACPGETLSVSTDQPVLSHYWFDENLALQATSPTALLGPGLYSVVVEDARGCLGRANFEMGIYPEPTVYLSTPDNTYQCNFIEAGVTIVANTDGDGYQFLWYHNDVLIGPGGPVLTVTDFGEYHVEVINEYGCKAVSLKIEFINCCPPDPCSLVLQGSPAGCLVIPTGFAVEKTELDCRHKQYTPSLAGIEPNTSSWAIASASEGIFALVNTDILTYTYTSPGYYELLLISQLTGFPYDATTCGHFQIIHDTVRAIADFVYTGLCEGEAFQFTDLTTFLPNETIASWEWEFGDPASGTDNSSSLKDPQHLFTSSGFYTVTLNITLASGCSTTKTRVVEVAGGPVLSPAYEPAFCEHEAQSFSLPGDVFFVKWEFGDPASGIENAAHAAEVFHTYSAAGTYTITVGASNVIGCRSQMTFTTTIVPNILSGDIVIHPDDEGCHGDTVVLTAPAAEAWQWNTSETMQAIDVTETGTYNVLIRDEYHCLFTPTPALVYFHAKPQVIVSAHEILGNGEYGPWQQSLALCYGTEFELEAFASGTFAYYWTTGDETKSISFTDEGGNLPLPGMYEFGVVVSNHVDCLSDTAYLQVEIYALPQIPVVQVTSGSGCSFDDNVLTITNPEAGIVYTWSDGQAGTSIVVTQAGQFYVTAENANGCTQASNTIDIAPSAPVDLIPGGCFIKCDPLVVCLPDIQPISSYTILHNGIPIASGAVLPDSYTIDADGSYAIEVVTPNGCVATSDPLDIVLYTGVGSITVLTYLDSNGDGIISAGDALLPGMPVQIISDDLLHAGATYTESDGGFVFEDYPAIGYTALFDTSLLSSQYEILVDSVHDQIATCDDSVVVSLLLGLKCSVPGPDVYLEMCPGDEVTLGDSSWTSVGSYVMHMESASGCDSVFGVHVNLHDTLEINTTVWVDVDENGVLSAADTTVQGITIIIDKGINQAPYLDITDVQGETTGLYPPGPYIIAIDSTLLPAGFSILYGIDFIPDTACFTTSFNFLLGSSCTNVYHIADVILCQGDSVQVEGQWIHAPGAYYFITGQSGLCDTILEVVLDTFPQILAQAVSDWSCVDLGSVNLDISGAAPFVVAWDHGVSCNSGTGLFPGFYSYAITDNNGCVLTDSIAVVEEPLLDFSIQPLFEVDAGDSAIISLLGDTSQPGLQIQWSASGILNCDHCTTVIATPAQDTLLFITIIDENGCEYALETQIIIREDSALVDALYVPNVFTPNGDGVNDHWYMTSLLPEAFVSRIVIFDRWGNMVYEKKDFMLNEWSGWDGTFKNQMLNPAVFAFSGTVRLSDGVIRLVKGDITLVR